MPGPASLPLRGGETWRPGLPIVGSALRAERFRPRSHDDFALHRPVGRSEGGACSRGQFCCDALGHHERRHVN